MTQSYVISTNPSDNYKEIGRVKTTTPEEITKIVNQSEEAFKLWSTTDIKQRILCIKNIATSLSTQINEIAKLQSQEMGKPLKDSISEGESILSWINWQIDNCEEILKPKLLDKYDEYQTYLHLEPHGVCAVITPWNYPTYQFFLATVQFLLSGNTIILKPSEECSLTSKHICALMTEFLPENVLQCVYGDRNTGALLLDEDVKFIYFTGSTKAGQEIYKKAAEKFIPSILEMGGSSPAIVFEDVNIEEVCNSIYEERYSNSGQICCALKRLIVHESIQDEVITKLKELIENQTVGDPLDEKTTLGPLVAERQLKLATEQLEDAKSKNANIITSSQSIEDLNGAYCKPYIITNVTEDMRVMTEEVFAPILPIVTFKTEEEALKIANNTEFGLSAFVYSKNIERSNRVANKMQAGQVSINGSLYFSENSPFGGYKKSGMGRSDGRFGYTTATQMKVIAKPIED